MARMTPARMARLNYLTEHPHESGVLTDQVITACLVEASFSLQTHVLSAVMANPSVAGSSWLRLIMNSWLNKHSESLHPLVHQMMQRQINRHCKSNASSDSYLGNIRGILAMRQQALLESAFAR